MPSPTDSSLLRYAGMATQFAVAIGAALWLGDKADHWLGFHTPIFVWALPLLVIAGLIFRVIRDTTPRKP